MTVVLAVEWLTFTEVEYEDSSTHGLSTYLVTGVDNFATSTVNSVRTNGRDQSNRFVGLRVSLTATPGQGGNSLRYRATISQSYLDASGHPPGSTIMPLFKGALKFVKVAYVLRGEPDPGNYFRFDSTGHYAEYFRSSDAFAGMVFQAPKDCVKIYVFAIYGHTDAKVITVLGSWAGDNEGSLVPYAGGVDVPWAEFYDYCYGRGYDSVGDGRMCDMMRQASPVPKRHWTSPSLSRLHIRLVSTMLMFLVSGRNGVEVHTVNPINPDIVRLPGSRDLPNLYAFDKWRIHFRGGPTSWDTDDYTAGNLDEVVAYYQSLALCSSKFDSRSRSVGLVYGRNNQLLYDQPPMSLS